MTRKRDQALLAAIVLFALGWDMWAVLSDQRWTTADNFTPRAITLLLLGAEDWLRFLVDQAPKGPVLPALAAPLIALTGQDMVGGRLLSVLCHLAMMLLAHRLATRLLPFPGAGLWAALLCAATPMVFGWCRLEYGEPLVACLLLASMLILARPLETWRAAVALGLLTAAGVLTKPGHAVFMLFPVCWCLPRQLGSRRRALLGAAAVAVALLPVVPWALMNRADLAGNLAASGGAGADAPWLTKAGLMLHMPGVAPLLLLSALALPALLRRGALSRWQFGWLAGTIFAPVLAFIFVFHLWSRYLMPALALGAVVAGGGIALALGALPPGLLRRAAAGACAAALLGMAAWFNLTWPPHEPLREVRSGMVAPDRRPFDGLAHAVGELHRRGVDRALFGYDSGEAIDRWEGIDDLLMFRRTPVRDMSASQARTSLARGQVVWALFISTLPMAELAGAEFRPLSWAHQREPSTALVMRDSRWMLLHPGREIITTTRDPDGFFYSVFRLRPAGVGGRRP